MFYDFAEVADWRSFERCAVIGAIPEKPICNTSNLAARLGGRGLCGQRAQQLRVFYRLLRLTFSLNGGLSSTPGGRFAGCCLLRAAGAWLSDPNFGQLELDDSYGFHHLL